MTEDRKYSAWPKNHTRPCSFPCCSPTPRADQEYHVHAAQQGSQAARVPAEFASRWATLDELASVLGVTFKEFEPDYHVPCASGIKFGTENGCRIPKGPSSIFARLKDSVFDHHSYDLNSTHCNVDWSSQRTVSPCE